MYFVLGGKQGNAQGHVLRTRIENHGFARASVTYGGELSLATNPTSALPYFNLFKHVREKRELINTSMFLISEYCVML